MNGTEAMGLAASHHVAQPILYSINCRIRYVCTIRVDARDNFCRFGCASTPRKLLLPKGGVGGDTANWFMRSNRRCLLQL